MTAVEITSLSLTAIGLAFAAGLLSFVSPCVLPLLPVYLSFISGVGVEDLGREHRRLLGTSLLFVAGFTVVFMLMGAGAGGIGRLLIQYRDELMIAAGAFIAFSGLVVAGVDQAAGARAQGRAQAGRRRRRLPHRRRARHRLDAVRRLRPRRHPLHGRDQPERASPARCSCSSTRIGLGVPFVLAALAFDWVSARLGWVKRHYRGIQVTAGVAARRLRRAHDVRRPAAALALDARRSARAGS